MTRTTRSLIQFVGMMLLMTSMSKGVNGELDIEQESNLNFGHRALQTFDREVYTNARSSVPNHVCRCLTSACVVM
jgi:hypothetical protein